MSSPDVAYAMHTTDTLQYNRPRRSISGIDPEYVRGNIDILLSTEVVEDDPLRTHRARQNLTEILGLPLDIFSGEHGMIDDEALVRTARYVARSTEKYRLRNGQG